MPKFWENSKFFSLNAQSLRLWNSSLTQNWIHITIFEKLIISFWECIYAISCSYMLCHWSGIRTESIPMTQDDIICVQGLPDCTLFFPTMGFSYSAIVHVKATIVMLLSGDTCRVVQQALHRRLWVKTVGTPPSFPLPYSHRGFGVTHIQTHFLL